MFQRKYKYNKKQRAQYGKTVIRRNRWSRPDGAEGDEDVDHTEEVDGTENNGVGEGGDKQTWTCR